MMALILGASLLHGITLGPTLMFQHPEMFRPLLGSTEPEMELAHPLGMRLAANWAPYHLRDFRTLFDELLHSFRLDLIARSREFDDRRLRQSGKRQRVSA